MKNTQSHFDQLKDSWLNHHADVQQALWDKHKETLEWAQNSSKQLAAGSVAGLIMMASPASAQVLAPTLEPALPTPVPTIDREADRMNKLLEELQKELPAAVQPLDEQQNAAVASTLSDYFHMPVTAVLDGKQLNRTYGIIGAEQHLMRYPGDTMASHFDTEEERKFTSSGMAPGRGAWGYFAPSQADMTDQIKDREKYYIAVQTFLSPGWGGSTKELYNFFKFRKMLVVNPENGNGVVVVIGDAGPAQWTGKHLGGSPEVMGHLKRVDGRARGAVLYFFIDDPEDKVPLGPVQVQ